MNRLILYIVLLLWPWVAWSGEIVLPAPALDRDVDIQARYRIDAPTTGRGTLIVTWTDVYSRLIEQRSIPVDLRGGLDVAFPLDLRRAVAMRNRLTVRLSLAGIRREGVPHGRSRQRPGSSPGRLSPPGGTTRSSCGRHRRPSST